MNEFKKYIKLYEVKNKWTVFILREQPLRLQDLTVYRLKC
jgi:hypothetical protein